LSDLKFHFKRKESNIDLPKPGTYCVGVFFMTKENLTLAKEEFEKVIMGYNLKVVVWRQVPVNTSKIGVVARKSEPLIFQVNIRNFI